MDVNNDLLKVPRASLMLPNQLKVILRARHDKLIQMILCANNRIEDNAFKIAFDYSEYLMCKRTNEIIEINGEGGKKSMC
jgi:hypothetical protein